MSGDRIETLTLIDEAVAAGCRLGVASAELGLSLRTVQRWRRVPDGGDDRRRGPNTKPSHALSEAERAEVVRVANQPEHRNLSPKQIVPKLADGGVYIASESTFYRIFREDKLLAHRGASRPRTVTRPEEIVAQGPNEVWSWDITYLPAAVKGTFYYLYLFVDVWSRRIMKAVVLPEESADHAAELIRAACAEHGVTPRTLCLHSDNGSPMKGATMLATMQALGVVPSFSRPSVSDDNPFSEALFRTLKYTPAYPRKPFESLDAAWAWVERFVGWYNHEHLHSAIGFVTPDQRHHGDDLTVLTDRRAVYEAARMRNPARWSRRTREWDAPALVPLNPREPETRARAAASRRLGAMASTSMAPNERPCSATTSHRRQTDEALAS
jgi:transposase InsO family protein